MTPKEIRYKCLHPKDPDGNGVGKLILDDKLYMRCIVLDILEIWKSIEEGNQVEGSTVFPEAVARKYFTS